MGVINLGALVEKLKTKLSASGFIKNTDYASGTKGGVIKTDSTYATDITSGGKLKSTTIAAASYADANSAAFISKGTLDALITAGTIGGGGMTWTKLYEDSAAASSVKTFAEGVHLYAHRIIVVQVYTSEHLYYSGFLLTEVIIENENSLNFSMARADGIRTIIFTDTGFTMPSNMNATKIVIYGLD